MDPASRSLSIIATIGSVKASLRPQNENDYDKLIQNMRDVQLLVSYLHSFEKLLKTLTDSRWHNPMSDCAEQLLIVTQRTADSMEPLVSDSKHHSKWYLHHYHDTLTNPGKAEELLNENIIMWRELCSLVSLAINENTAGGLPSEKVMRNNELWNRKEDLTKRIKDIEDYFTATKADLQAPIEKKSSNSAGLERTLTEEESKKVPISMREKQPISRQHESLKNAIKQLEEHLKEAVPDGQIHEGQIKDLQPPFHTLDFGQASLSSLNDHILQARSASEQPLLHVEGLEDEQSDIEDRRLSAFARAKNRRLRTDDEYTPSRISKARRPKTMRSIAQSYHGERDKINEIYENCALAESPKFLTLSPEDRICQTVEPFERWKTLQEMPASKALQAKELDTVASTQQIEIISEMLRCRYTVFKARANAERFFQLPSRRSNKHDIPAIVVNIGITDLAVVRNIRLETVETFFEYIQSIVVDWISTASILPERLDIWSAQMDKVELLIKLCEGVAKDLDVEPSILYDGAAERASGYDCVAADVASAIFLWVYTASLLDLLLITAAASYTDDFLSGLPGSLDDVNDTVRTSFSDVKLTEELVMCCRSVACLDGFLDGRKIWALQSSRFPIALKGQKLYLATTITDFEALWGAVWPVKHDGQDTVLPHCYRTRYGYILPWIHDRNVTLPRAPPARFCHWVPAAAFAAYRERQEGEFESSSENSDGIPMVDDDSEEWEMYDLDAPTFQREDLLIIGMPRSPRLGWYAPDADLAADHFKDQMRGQNRLHRLNTRGLFYYFDPSFTVSAGSHGATIGASLVPRTDEGEIWKKVLLDTWELEPDNRNPREFENFWGVAISMCTMNACRLRLVELLGTPSIEKLLQPFMWSDLEWNDSKNEYTSVRRKAFFQAVRDHPFALGDLWDSHEDWREELGKVLLTCLRALSKTGFDARREEFYVLWHPSHGSTKNGPYRVTLTGSENNWVRALRDSDSTMAMAVLVEDALRPSRYYHHARRWHDDPTPSMLETAIYINQSIRPPQLRRIESPTSMQVSDWRTADHAWRFLWNVRGISEGEPLWLPNGRLRVQCPIDDLHLLVKWDTVKRDVLRSKLHINRSQRSTHWEYVESESDDDEGYAKVRPVPVHVQ